MGKKNRKSSLFILVYCDVCRASPGNTVSAGELEYVGRAAFLHAQPMAGKDKSPWNRRSTLLGCSPSAASVEISITGVLIS